MKILFLPKYNEEGASSRYRIYQYLEFFRDKIEFEVKPLFFEGYIRNFEKKRTSVNKLLLPFAYVRRLFHIFKLHKFDIIYIEKETTPYFPPILERYMHFFKIKYILDYDDAIFHNYDKSKSKLVKLLFSDKIPNIIKLASGIITGSPYLTRFAQKYNNNVIEIPTSIDYRRYKNAEKIFPSNERFIVGWIGGRATSVHLSEILDSLLKITQKYPDIHIHLIGFNKESVSNILKGSNRVRIIKWEDENEVNELASFNVGIMPLKKTLLVEGKCGFKLIQYMACGKPTISSPYETNIKIDSNNGNLFAASKDDWYNKIEEIYLNYPQYIMVGEKNRLTVKKKYSIQANFELYLSVFRMVLDN